MRRIFTLFFILTITGTLTAQISKRALFIGNSYTATNNLPQMIADAAASTGDVLEFDMQVPGGYTFELHSENPTTLELIAEGTWDIVVLQEQSQIPSFPIAQVEVECFPFALKLDSLIREANACTETMFFMTWGRKDGDAMNCPTWPPVCTYDGMDSLLHERYMMMGADNSAEVSPVGAVWHFIRDTYPEIELYLGDGSHPSGAGSYAAACAFYAAIFRKDPTLITYNYTLPADQAANIRAAAKAVVYDSLSAWYIGTYTFDPHAVFTATTDIPLTAVFENLSTGAEDFLWDLGDGTTSTVASPTHVYADAGTYTVSLTAITCDTADAVTQTIEILEDETSAVEDMSAHIQIYPNPVGAALQVYTTQPISTLFIADLQGRLHYTANNISGVNHTINVGNLSPGLYMLVVERAGMMQSVPFVKE